MVHVRRQDWLAVALDFVLVILGIFLGLQANEWAQGVADRAEERRYLVRLLADAKENGKELADLINGHRAVADIFLRLQRAALDANAPLPAPDELSRAMCKWFVQPAASLQRSTYAELVASGKLVLLTDEGLRLLLAREDQAHAMVGRLDILVPAVQRAAEPIEAYRSWFIDEAQSETARTRVTCRFDAARLRADKRMPTVAAQLYRDQLNYLIFRTRALEALWAVERRLKEQLGRR
jgi:hypothetical protein